jgi:acyl-CoA synthetase (NDP forming)
MEHVKRNVSSGSTRSADLSRLFSPRSIAIVGASDNQLRSRNAASAIRESGIELYLVNPNRSVVRGVPELPGLDAIEKPVDAVLSLVGAEATVALVEQCGRLGVGGVVAIAGGFGESGGGGQALAHRLARRH